MMTLGVLGLRRIGSQVARGGSAFGMNLIAWSQNMTAESPEARAQSWFPITNGSSGPIGEEQALISVLKNKQIAGAAIDVFDIEPLLRSHPFRTLNNVL